MRVILVVGMVLSGTASQYAPGLMDSVVEVRRGKSLHSDVDLSEYDGACAFILPEYIGREIHVRPAGQEEWERLLVVDTAGLADGGLGFMLWGKEIPLGMAEAGYHLGQVRNGTIQPAVPIEVDYETAQRWDSVGYGAQVEVRVTEPLTVPMSLR